MLPLAHLKVVDLTQALAGAYCAAMLADMGAEVTKIERPDTGDFTRQTPPFINGQSAAFMTVNRGKKSVTLNLKNPQGREVLLKLVQNADILVENYTPGTLESLGLGYAALSKLNPRLVYCSISGFGQTGPYSHRGGFDLIAQGMGGMMSVQGQPGQPPEKVALPVTDIGAAMYAVQGILLALIALQRTGEGQQVDASLFECAVGWALWEGALYFGSGEIPKPSGSAHRLGAPYQAFKTKDGYINIAAVTLGQWQQLCGLLHLDKLVDDPRFKTPAARAGNQKELAQLIEQALAGQGNAYWLERLDKLEIPSGPINPYDVVFSDPHVLSRDMVVETQHSVAGKFKMVGIPVKLSKTPGRIREAAPVLGQHTRDVLLGLGYGDQDIARFKKAGAI